MWGTLGAKRHYSVFWCTRSGHFSSTLCTLNATKEKSTDRAAPSSSGRLSLRDCDFPEGFRRAAEVATAPAITRAGALEARPLDTSRPQRPGTPRGGAAEWPVRFPCLSRMTKEGCETSRPQWPWAPLRGRGWRPESNARALSGKTSRE